MATPDPDPDSRDACDAGSLYLRFAHILSRLSHPLYLSPLVILAASLRNASPPSVALFWWGLYQVFATFIPLCDLIWRRRTGRINDWHVSRREERKWPLLFGVLYAAAGSLVLYLLSAPSILQACMLSGLALGIITLAVTSFWKISLHLMGNASLAVILLAAFDTPLFSASGLLCLLYLAAIGLSRYAVKAHTPAQIVAGAATGITITQLVFVFMGIRF
jgi:membrane-associated phospholipid phosphatase